MFLISFAGATALTASATDTGTPGRDPYYGYGSLDAAAMARLLAR